MLDCEVDYLMLTSAALGIIPASRQEVVANLASGACATWWLSAAPARPDTIRRGFQERLRYLKTGEYEAFRMAWIARFRELGCAECEPESFFE